MDSAQNLSWQYQVACQSRVFALADNQAGFEKWVVRLCKAHRQFAIDKFQRYSHLYDRSECRQAKRYNPYERAGALPLDFVFANVGKKVMTDYGELANCSSWRIKAYASKGVVCAFCGLDGTMFAMERFKSAKGVGPFHLNLYHVHADGSETMITVDHVVPKSKGGRNGLSNLQTLCFPCNNMKGSTMVTKPHRMEKVHGN